MIGIKFVCERVCIEDLIGSVVAQDTLTFSLAKINSGKKTAIFVNEENGSFLVKGLKISPAIRRPDYVGLFAGFEIRNNYTVCFMPVRTIVDHIVKAASSIGLKEIYCKFYEDDWELVWEKCGYCSERLFTLPESEVGFISLSGTPEMED